ncbi:MAG: hypothetical protein ACKO2P_11290, partial [Planctomycetota bacterium]
MKYKPHSATTPPLNQPPQLHTPALVADSRRHFFDRCAVGLGSMALATLAAPETAAAQPPSSSPLQPKPAHHPAKA